MTLAKVKKTPLIPISLYVYSIAYLVFVFLLPVIYQNKRFSDILPQYPSIQVFIIGYFIGLFGIFILSITSKTIIKYINGLFIIFVLFGSIYINGYNLEFNEDVRIPLIFIVEPGVLNDLAAQRWKREIPFDVYYSVFEEYPLMVVNINPNIPNYQELRRIQGFGVYIDQNNDAPISLTSLQYTRIRENEDLYYSQVWDGEFEYLLYKIGEDPGEILLTTYNNKILFLPIGLISE